MAFTFVFSLKSINCRAKYRRWLIQKSCETKALALYRFAKVILKHSTLAVARNADHNVPQADIMFWTWRTATDADH
jgi:hypothetical protein